MNIIYEAFLFNFYKIKTNYRVECKKRYSWDLVPINNSKLEKLPIMETDIEITNGDNKIIIDAKYYKNAFSNPFEMLKYHSTNMYQMNTYLIHQKQHNSYRGILLYPSNGYHISDKFIQNTYNYTIEFKTIDLNQRWNLIQDELLK